jgi:nitrite reductase/ring-hydroxylating ferredoxin subunit
MSQGSSQGSPPEPVAVCAAADVAPGSVIGVEIDDRPLAIYNIAGTFYATDGYCTHAMAHLADGFLDGDVIECSMHFGSFHVPTGEVRQPPCTVALKTYPAAVRDGKVFVTLD